VFSELDVWRVVNFANFAYVLFSGADRPACCLFYKPGNAPSEAGAKPIVALAPLVADQGANRPNKAGGRLGTWNILVRESDWREIDRDEARRGDRLTWKLAMWGGVREAGLIRRLGRFPRFADWSKDAGFTVAAGPELRKGPGEGLTLIRQLIGQRVVSFRSTKGEEAFFRIPRSCLSDPLQQERCYLRDRGGLKGLAVCEPPHLVVNKGRRFAVFSKDFLVVPPGENGIQGENVALLKALALYLISPPARWHQFFISSEWGVSTSVARLDDLQALPIPLSHEGSAPTEELAALYDQLAEDEEQGCPDKDALLVRAEAIVWRLCNLRAQERELIEGFFSGPYQCIKGKCPDDAIQPAMRSDVQGYCRILRRELDDYLEQQGVRHQIVASVHENEVCLTIEGRRTSTAIEPVVQGVSDRQAEAITSIDRWLRQKHSQRAYFEKSLFFYDHDHGRVMFLKPRRRIEWNVRQALLDADDVIAELLSGRD
jgi:hypothetical protein